jgi:AcrR family transcriptional regulator
VVARLRSDARDNRERILAAARAAFGAEGLDVSIREIARRAEVGPATVYRHFPTKAALRTEALRQQQALCSAVVSEGLSAEDPWTGFQLVVDRLMAMHTLDRGFVGAIAAARPSAVEFAADREQALRLLLELVGRAKSSGVLRADFVLQDLSLALMANNGIQAETPAMTVVASQRFAALMLQSFKAPPVTAPLPPAVPMPLPRR